MNMIPQNFINVLKNEIKNVINDKVDVFIDTIADVFNSNNSLDKYTNVFITADRTTKELILSIIKTLLENIDNHFKCSEVRIKNYVVNKSNVPRTITTIFGDLTFYRTYYQSRFDNSLHFLLDESLGLEKYDKYDHLVKSLAIDNAFNTNQKKAGEIIGKQISFLTQLFDKNAIKNIPRQSINNWINEWNVPDFESPERDTPNTLFIMVDEKYLGCQDLENDIMVKSFVSFEGVKNISKSRRKLLNRLIFSTYNKNAWGEYVDWLYKIYDSEKIETIYLMSDGGTWIKAGIDELRTNPNQVIKRLLCEFHLKQAINRMTTDKDFREIINISFKEDKKKDFIFLVNNLLTITPDKKNTIEKNITYISNNYKAMKDMIDFEIGSSMESHISHYIASYFSSRPKGYSSSKINKYLKINDYNNNDINIFNLYLKSYNKDSVITINSDNIHITNYKQSSNMPILYSNNADIKTLFDLNKIKTANVII